MNSTINRCEVNQTVPPICQNIPLYSTNTTNTTDKISNTTTYTTFHEQIWCDSSQMEISCNSTSNGSINIICAFYGLHPSLAGSCNLEQVFAPNEIPICYFESSFTIVYEACNNKSMCGIGVDSNTFMNPCHNTNRALFAQWSCNYSQWFINILSVDYRNLFLFKTVHLNPECFFPANLKCFESDIKNE